jgi:1-aminocyclopropane-1-carboxylate deaminase
MWHSNLNSPLQPINDFLLHAKEIQLHIKRDDLIHPEISGNKWRKLKYNVIKAKELDFETIITFGGAFSNHIAATAAAGKEFNIKTTGIIRGEETLPLNSTLLFATKCGMQLKYMDRSTYREKQSDSVLSNLKNEFGNFWLIPEGGYNKEGAKGCEEIVNEIDIDFDVICCACGTATTISGIINATKPQQKSIGFPALKGGAFLKENIQTLTKNTNYELITDYHFGGYAKYKPELIEFIKHFKSLHNISLDPVYTGKMMFGLFDLIQKDYFKKGTNIIVIHTGGLQGIEGFNKRYKTDL